MRQGAICPLDRIQPYQRQASRYPLVSFGAEGFVSFAFAMNRSEQLVRRHFQLKAFPDIVHEPDGKVSPDFLLNGRIAVEVRRLDQNKVVDGKHRSLEHISMPLHAAVVKILASMGPPVDGASWYVSYRFRRPLPPWGILKRDITAALRRFQQGARTENERKQHLSGCSLDFYPAGTPYPWMFVLAGYSDGDAGGFVVAEVIRNLRLCIEEKTQKIERVRQRYPEWWLYLEDRISYGNLDANDVSLLREHMTVAPPWSRIVLVSPADPSVSFEL